MIYNLYELAEIYGVSRQFLQRKYNQHKSNLEATGRQPQETKKDNRLALQDADLTAFIEFLSYDTGQITGNREETARQPGGNPEATKNNQLFNKLIKEKSGQIEYLKKQIELLQAEKDKIVDLNNKEKANLIDTFKDESYRKDVLLKEAIGNINAYKTLNKGIIKAIEQAKNETIELIDTGKKRIAIIEDNEDIAELLKMNLEKAGYETYIFLNVNEATKYYIKGLFNLTLLDLRLTEQDKFSGEKFWQILKKHSIETPVIIISGESEERINKAVQDTGAICNFKKPLDIKGIIEKIKEVL